MTKTGAMGLDDFKNDCFSPALRVVRELAQKGQPAVVAIDGRCGSGKTALAARIAQLFPCNVLHLDDFYLPPDRRPPDWETIPAGHMDLERFLEEALLPACAGQSISYRPYHCRTGQLGPARPLSPRPLTVVEGCYAHHPLLASRYDRKLFLTCSPAVQAQRLRAREGARYPAFPARWIPLEERYFQLCQVERAADLILDTSEFF
jgi:uridine kinase